MPSKGMVVRTNEAGETHSLDSVDIWLADQGMWLAVMAPKGGIQGSNQHYPHNIAVGRIKEELKDVASPYKGMATDKIYMYDVTESFETKTVICGGYEYLDVYVVKPGTKLYCATQPMNTAGTFIDENPPHEHNEWDGATWVQYPDKGQRWEKVLLPDLPEGEITCNMLKRPALAKINEKADRDTVKHMRVFRCHQGVPFGRPFAGSDAIVAHHYCTVVINKDADILVLAQGKDLPSPETSSEASWYRAGDDDAVDEQ